MVSPKKALTTPLEIAGIYLSTSPTRESNFSGIEVCLLGGPDCVPPPRVEMVISLKKQTPARMRVGLLGSGRGDMSRTNPATDWNRRHTAAFRRRLLRRADFAGMGV